MRVRVRFAPSPTGLLHLGGARTALFNYLYAKANGGHYILRIEDTDKDRYVPGSIQKLEETLRWLGIEFHESPSKGGPYGPYLQSERVSLYRHYAQQLIQRGSGYPCFCSKERLQSLREQGWSAGYDGLCRSLSRQKVEERLSMGMPFTVRLKVPREQVIAVQDEVYGRVEVRGDHIEDQILLKTDGFPTYHLACVVDDNCMEISHVLRGEEWLLSTAKHLLLYQGLGWSPPMFAHLPLLLSSTGEKLSKRQHDATVDSYKERGFLPEAVTGFLSQLGWSSGKDSSSSQEMVPSLEGMAGRFSLEGLSKRPVSVDEQKLLWINKHHFLKRLQNPSQCEELARQLHKQLQTSLQLSSDLDELELEYLIKVLFLLEDRISLIPKIPTEAAYFWKHPVLSKEALFLEKNSAAVMVAVKEALSRSCDFSKEGITSALKSVSTALDIPHRNTMQLCRAAVIGQPTSPSLSAVMELLGRETVLERLTLAINIMTL